MIKRILLQRLRNAEYFQLMTDLLGITDAATAATIDAQRTALQGKVAQIDDLFKRDPASGLTDDLAALDARRDDIITGIVLLCEAFKHHPAPSPRAAAELLAHNLDVYGSNIAAQSYNAQSATITNILNDWANDAELAAAGAQLNITDWTGSLEAINESFKATYMTRTAEMAAEAIPDTLKSLRLEANDLWYALRDKVDGYYQVTDGAAPWSTIVPQINALIDQYNALLDSRKGNGGTSGGGTGGGSQPGGGGTAQLPNS